MMPRVASSWEVRDMLATVDGIRRAGHGMPDMTAIKRALVTLASDAGLFRSCMRAMPAHKTAATWLHLPERGPRLALVHRPAGHMSAIHSHHVWVCLAPIAGAEQHEVFYAHRRGDGSATVDLVSFETITPGHAAHLIPPGDVHSHGHIRGTGGSPYTLVLLGDNMLRCPREEYTRDTWRALSPGDPGTVDRLLDRYGM